MKRRGGRGGPEGERAECHLDEHYIYMCTYTRPRETRPLLRRVRGQSDLPPQGSAARRPPPPPPRPGGLGEPGGPGYWGSRERQKGLHPSCLTGDTGGDPGLLLPPDQCRASSALGRAALPGARAARGTRGVGSPAWRGRAAPGAHQRPRGQSVCISPINGISCPPLRLSAPPPAPAQLPRAGTSVPGGASARVSARPGPRT